MKNASGNTAYNLNEAKIIFKNSMISNILSILSLALIFFLFSAVVTGKLYANFIESKLTEQAAINVYYDDEEDKQVLEEALSKIAGVKKVTAISAEEAVERMKSVLGEDSDVFEYIEENPFVPFLELDVNLENLEEIVSEVNTLPEVASVRDNLEILKGLRHFIGIINWMLAFVALAVGITTVILTGHIIRQGIYNNREQIETLNLLGAPAPFIMMPYLIEGTFIALSGGIIAAVTSGATLYGVSQMMKTPLPFIPLPSAQTVFPTTAVTVLCVSAILGVGGSVMGWFSVNNRSS